MAADRAVLAPSHLTPSGPLPAGVGLGWRPQLAGVASARPLAFLEVVAETLDPGAPLPAGLDAARRAGVPVVPHGVTLGIGSAEGLDRPRLERLAAVADLLDAPVVGEHLSFVGAAGLSAGHLLPLPRTREGLDVLVPQIRQAQQVCGGRPLALEHVAALFEWPDAELDPADYLTRVVERTGCLLVLDLANLYGDLVNFGVDPLDLLDRIPLEQVAYVHLAGGQLRDGVWHDTHAAAVPDPVYDLLAELVARRPDVAVMLERDDRWPAAGELHAELDRMESVIARARGLATVTGG